MIFTKIGVFFVIFLFNFRELFAAKFPNYLNKCKRDDPNLNKCVLKSAQDGYSTILQGDPELGIPSYIPVVVQEKIFLGSGGFQFDISNLKLLNVNSSVISNAYWNLQRKQVFFLMLYDRIDWDFELEANGAFLGQNFHARGHGTKSYLDGWYTYEMEYEPVNVNGVIYPKIKGGNSEYEADNIIYNFENLENAELSQDLIRSFWKDFDQLFHLQIRTLAFNLISPAFEAIFKVTPINELFE